MRLITVDCLDVDPERWPDKVGNVSHFNGNSRKTAPESITIHNTEKWQKPDMGMPSTIQPRLAPFHTNCFGSDVTVPKRSKKHLVGPGSCPFQQNRRSNKKLGLRHHNACKASKLASVEWQSWYHTLPTRARGFGAKLNPNRMTNWRLCQSQFVDSESVRFKHCTNVPIANRFSTFRFMNLAACAYRIQASINTLSQDLSFGREVKTKMRSIKQWV